MTIFHRSTFKSQICSQKHLNDACKDKSKCLPRETICKLAKSREQSCRTLCLLPATVRERPCAFPNVPDLPGLSDMFVGAWKGRLPWASFLAWVSREFQETHLRPLLYISNPSNSICKKKLNLRFKSLKFCTYLPFSITSFQEILFPLFETYLILIILLNNIVLSSNHILDHISCCIIALQKTGCRVHVAHENSSHAEISNKLYQK